MQIKENIKVLCHWSLWGNPPVTGGFPSQMLLLFPKQILLQKVRGYTIDHLWGDSVFFNLWFKWYQWVSIFSRRSLQWRHNGHDGVSNHQPQHCLLTRLFGRRSNKTSKLRVTGLCAGNSPGTGEFPAQMASNAENVSIWWRHHVSPRPHTRHSSVSISCTHNHITSIKMGNIGLHSIYFW